MKLRNLMNRRLARLTPVLFGLLFFIALFSTESCSKDSQDNSMSAIQTIDGFRLNIDPVDEIPIYEGSDERTIANEKLFILATALNSMIKDKSYINEIISVAPKSDVGDRMVKFKYLTQDVPNFKSDLSSAISSTASNGLRTNDDIEDYLSNYAIENELYDSRLFLYNFENADFNLSPIVTPGIEVEDNQIMGIEDCIFAYYNDENLNTYEIILSEQEALETDIPIIVIGLSPEEETVGRLSGKPTRVIYLDPLSNRDSQPLDLGLSHDPSINAKVSNSYQLEINQIQIKTGYRYESSGKSEYSIAGVGVDYNGDDFIFFLDPGTARWPDPSWAQWEERLVRDVESYEIGDILTLGQHFANWPFSGNNPNVQPYFSHYYFNTWERDWYGGWEFLGTVPFDGFDLEFRGKMALDHEWYLCDPTSGACMTYSGNYSPPTFIDKEFETSKSYLKLTLDEL